MRDVWGTGLAKDLTGVSTVEDVTTALAMGSFQPVLNFGDGLDGAEKLGGYGAKILSGTAGKVLGGIGKAAGKAGTAFSLGKAGVNLALCEGW